MPSSSLATESKPQRGIFNDTSYFLLSLVSVANGLSYNVMLWQNGELASPFSPVIIIALFTIGYLHVKTSNHTSVTPQEKENIIVPCCVLILTSLIPSAFSAWIGLFAAAIWRYSFTKKLKMQFILWALIATSFLWKICLFKISSASILSAETWVIGTAILPFFPEIYTVGNHLHITESHVLSIGIGCSCFSNLSFVLLGWVALFYLKGGVSVSWKWPTMIAIFLMITNIIRIGLMAMSYDMYVEVHEGIGVPIYDAILALIVVSALLFKPPKESVSTAHPHQNCD
ncbi:hypothetical protein [Enterovibrio calviensis]|uniref:hypothetical protein n=1 Tax=Enterovibrio calviensis TaxID=91359 RepID=UPI003736C525